MKNQIKSNKSLIFSAIITLIMCMAFIIYYAITGISHVDENSDLKTLNAILIGMPGLLIFLAYFIAAFVLCIPCLISAVLDFIFCKTPRHKYKKFIVIFILGIAFCAAFAIITVLSQKSMGVTPPIFIWFILGLIILLKILALLTFLLKKQSLPEEQPTTPPSGDYFNSNK